MACGYWMRAMAEREAVFCLYFRSNPFGSGYTLAGGLASTLEYLERLRFDSDDLAYLAALPGADGTSLFPAGFLDYLAAFRFRCDVDAAPEGSVVFPNEPIVRVRGPVLQAQMVETAILNQINFQSLIATKAARVCQAAAGRPVIEFGLRRAQGWDGGLTASRAAYIGGCAATSNLAAGREYGIPVRGTHAHSWVMMFPDELQAFEAWAEAMPNNCVFLVDTRDTLQGVQNAIRASAALPADGRQPIGIRLDSGDLARLSIQARAMLDGAGLKDATIIASNDMDETVISALLAQGARIDAWGVGTRLVTGWDQPALGGVYKLTAVRDGETWSPVMKASEQLAKSSLPGMLQTARYTVAGELVGDVIFDELAEPEGARTLVEPLNPMRKRRIAADAERQLLLNPVMRAGVRTEPPEPISAVRDRAAQGLSSVPAAVKRFLNPQAYPAGLSPRLAEAQAQLLADDRS
ncbi:MAG: nicotinate phosphoribosyltransferase [Armatimonadetes bacterium]|nr:nicotinate phosphoribosyltransferase [Armatimonadota bacterium]MDE2205861.1 nicotinate phosphoribosyltransferase [Armatimonadota bacterium]